MARWRAHRGLTLEDIGSAGGMTRQAVHNVEQGTADITVRKLASICERALKIDLATFFGPLPKKAAA
jgi:transcriptional regulator with XRE-family HTH domain